MSARKSISITRNYNPTPDACVRALEVLLNRSAMKMANKPAPEPVGHDDVRKVQDAHTTNRIIPK